MATQDDIKVTLISHTKDPERTITAAIRQCYSPLSGAELKKKTSEGQKKRLISQIVKSGHTSTIEHASFTFSIENVSRVTEVQLVRHRIASYSIKSGRYNKTHTNYVIPPAIKVNKQALKIVDDFNKKLEVLVKELKDLGFKNEDVRFFTPQGTRTNIVVTMNARSLMNFFEHRLCQRAQWEIRALASKMLAVVKPVAPDIFKYAGPTCKTEKICWEGDLSCGIYKNIKGAELRERA